MIEPTNADLIKVRRPELERFPLHLNVTYQEHNWFTDLAMELNCWNDGNGCPTHDYYAWLGEMARRLREARDAVIQRAATALGPHEEQSDDRTRLEQVGV